MDEELRKMKEVLEARLKDEPGNAEAWRELSEVKMMATTPTRWPCRCEVNAY